MRAALWVLTVCRPAFPLFLSDVVHGLPFDPEDGVVYSSEMTVDFHTAIYVTLRL